MEFKRTNTCECNCTVKKYKLIKTVRASALPMMLKCGHARVLGEKFPETSEAAQDGTATHLEIADDLRGIKPAVSKEAKRAVEFVRSIAPANLDGIMLVEIPVSLDVDDDTRVTGHPDCIVILDDCIHIFDWKRSRFGRTLPPDENPQLITYGLAAAEGANKPFQVHIVFGDEEDETGSSIPRSSRVFEVAEHAELARLILQISTKDEAPCFGDHCGFCYTRHHCEAYRARVSTALSTFIPGGSVSMEMSEMSNMIALAEDWLKAAKQVRLDFVRSGGVVVRDGKRMHIATCKGRKSIDVEKLRADGLEEKYTKDGNPYETTTWRKVKNGDKS
jgi:hypothetical protein